MVPPQQLETKGNGNAEIYSAVSGWLAAFGDAYPVNEICADQQSAAWPAQLFCGESVGCSFPGQCGREAGNHMPEIMGEADSLLQIGVVT